jgi:hypothetical protein
LPPSRRRFFPDLGVALAQRARRGDVSRAQYVSVELRRSVDVAAADWLRAGLRGFDSHVVASVVPDGFPAYLRILHPAHGVDDQQVTWAGVAAWSGRTMHRLAQFDAVARPLPTTRVEAPPWDGQSPKSGNLPVDHLRILCGVLAQHTSTPESCWFCLWEGWGFTDEVRAGRLVRLPHRNYLLFEGPLNAVSELQEPFGYSVGTAFHPQSPNLFWPQDQAWCVASEIDLFCTLVAGSAALADDMLAESRLEVWRVDPGDPVTYDSDQINL